MRTPAVVVAAFSLALSSGLVAAGPAGADLPPSPTAMTDPSVDRDAHRAGPKLRVRTVVGGLDLPWDVRPTGDGALLVTERDRQRLSLVRKGARSTVKLRGERIWSRGESGLMGLEVDPRFARNGRIYTCSGWRKASGGRDIRVIRWKVNDARTSARRMKTLRKGIPTTSGRHAGCRLLLARNGALLVGTGDAAASRHPQKRRSLGGKVLRIDPRNGKRWPGNPWPKSRTKRRFVLTYGHRNVQGLAQRADGTLWSVEHGTFRNDEVNRLRGGRNYGWDPGPGYDESVPMTDHSLPGRQWNARWRSGRSTIATSGAAFLPGRGWKRLGGTLAVAALAGERLVFLRFNDRGGFVSKRTRLRGTYGRLRGVTVDTNGSLLVTTSNGGGKDRILRVRVRR